MLYFSSNYFLCCIKFNREIAITDFAYRNYANMRNIYSFLRYIFVKSIKRRERERGRSVTNDLSAIAYVDLRKGWGQGARHRVCLASPECRITSQIFAHTVIIIITSHPYIKCLRSFPTESVRLKKYCNQLGFGLLKEYSVTQFSIFASIPYIFLFNRIDFHNTHI